jgi:hypothetical protein
MDRFLEYLPIFLQTLKDLLPLATPVPNLLVTNKAGTFAQERSCP